MRAVLLFVVLALAPCIALADFTGRVVKVSDGDTFIVLVNKKQIRVRLDAIDAPERAGWLGYARLREFVETPSTERIRSVLDLLQ